MEEKFAPVCPHCNQGVMNSEGAEFDSVQEAEKYAEENCECYKASAMRRRAEVLENANQEIEALFPIPKNENAHEIVRELKKRELLNQLAELCYDRVIDGVSLKVSHLTKASIAQGSKCDLQISRTDKTTSKREV